MAGKAMSTVIFAVLLTATVSWAFGGAGVGSFGGTPTYLLMPDPPSNVTATAGNNQATVSFKPPKSEGGRPITRYTVTSHPEKMKASGKQSPITVRGLTNGKTYTFTVTATNSIGTGLASGPSTSVTPKSD